MKKIYVLMPLLLAMTTLSARGSQAAFPEKISAGDVELDLKGVSRLTVGYIFKVYDAALYQLPGQGPADVLADAPRRLEIRYLRSISREDFIDAADDMLGKQHAPAEIAAIQPGIDQINALYQGVKEGDVYTLTYLPGQGTELAFNGVSRGVIPGAEFARVYFSIWLGEKNPYQAFRNRLVGLK